MPERPFQLPHATAGALPVEEAQTRVLAEIALLPDEPAPLDELVGRVLREDVVASVDLPPADNSAMDGYAVRAADVADATAESPVRLRVTGDIAAGSVPTQRVESGTAMRIMTGAFVPAGADAVVQVEWTKDAEKAVDVLRVVRDGANIRRRGEDVTRGATVLRSGTVVTPAEVAMLAATHRTSALVSRRPVVAILSTGDELIDASEPPQPGKIVNTNSYMLAALVREAGATPRVLPTVRDEREATIRALELALGADFVVTSGGVSVGAFDFVKEALESLGAETKFWRVAMKPGKPFLFARVRDRVFFGLPGNPASCFVGFHLFVAPALRKATGRDDTIPPRIRVRAAASIKAGADRRVYVRARVSVRDGELVAEPLQRQGSGALTSLAGANALVIVEPEVERVEEGGWVEAVLLRAV